MDLDKAVAGGFVFLLLGGSFLAAVWALDSTLLPVAAVAYAVVALALLGRIRRAEKLD
jgi:membrane protein implicated in regulation of membrane protease activity